MSETDEQTISRQQKTIRGLYGDIVDLRVELGEFKAREKDQGWIPAIGIAIADEHRREAERKGK